VDVADIPVMIIVGHVEGRRRRGAATWRRAVVGAPRKATATVIEPVDAFSGDSGPPVKPVSIIEPTSFATGAWHVCKRSEGRVVGEPKELMKEGNIVILCD
jgi:hypothetical protein